MKLHRTGASASENGLRSADAKVEAILAVIKEGERFLVCSHAGPDGDAVGSMLAMGMLLEQMGKRVDMVSADRVPVVHRWLPGADRIQKALRVHGSYDAVILLECDGLARTGLHGLEKFSTSTSIIMRAGSSLPM